MSRKRGWIWLGNGLGTSQQGGSRRQGKRRRCAHVGGGWSGHERRLGCEPLEERRLLAITVDTLVDEADGSIVDGDVSLRDAIALAPAGETIDFAPELSGGTITLTLGELVIDKALTIDGPGADLMTIDASGNDPTPDVNNGDGSRVFNVDDGSEEINSDVAIAGLTITGGDGPGDAAARGAIHTLENVDLDGTMVTGNSAGVSILSTQQNTSLTIRHGFITANDGFGISVAVADNSITIEGTKVSTNPGIGVLARIVGSELIVKNSVIADNLTGGVGLLMNHDATMTITDSTISGNSVVSPLSGGTRSGHAFNGAGINITPVGAGTLTVSNTTVSDNTTDSGSGGGIYVPPSGDISVSIENSTISGNSAITGGGVSGPVTVSHSTITNNTATFVYLPVQPASGDEIMVYPAGAGIDGTATLDHTIVAGNTSNSAGRDDIRGTATARYSLIGDDSGATIIDDGGNVIGSDSAPIDPLLGALADNGGPTMTHALLPGSPAIDAGDPSFMPPPEFDQRGAPFVRVAGAAIDIGAFEVQPPTVQELLDQYVADGVFNHGQANSLWVKLAFQGNELAKPKRQQAFVNHVNAFVLAGILSDEQGQALIAALDSSRAPVSGDYNGDGVVNGLDYIAWASNYGASVTDSVARQRAAFDAVLTEQEDTVVPLQRARSVASGNDARLHLHVRLALDHAFDTWAVKKREK